MTFEMILSTDGKHSFWAKDVEKDEIADTYAELSKLYKGALADHGSKYQMKPANEFAASIGVTENDSKECDVHKVMMEKGFAKATGKPYWMHKGEDGRACFGTGWKDRK